MRFASFKSFAVAGASAIALSSGSLAYAQDNETPTEVSDEDAEGEIIVTGVVNGTRKIDTTFSITTLDQDDIEQLAPISTADLLGNIPGFFAEGSTAGEASNNITVRGLPVTGGFRYAPQLVDGLPVFQEPDVPFMNNDVFIRADLMTERVEVVKGGPGGILYSNGLGATVNYITKTGGQEFEGAYRLELTDYGFVRNDIYISGPINKNLTFALGGFYRTSQGLRDVGYTADRGGQIRGNLVWTSDDGQTSLALYGTHINDRTAFYQNLPIAVPGFNEPGTPENPIKIEQDTVMPIGINFQDGTTLSPFNRYINQVGEYGERTIDIGDGIHPEFSTITAKFSHELDSGWRFDVGFRHTGGTSGFNTIFTGNDASTSERFLQDRFNNDFINGLIQPAFDAQWQFAEGNPLNAPPRNRDLLATYFNAFEPDRFLNEIRNPILDSGFSRFDELRALWGSQALAAGPGVGVGGFYLDDGQPIDPAENLTFLIPFITQTEAKSTVQDIRIQKEFSFLGDHNLTIGGYHSNYSDDYNFQASLIVSTLSEPTRLVELEVIDAGGNPIGLSLTRDGAILPGFFGNTVSADVEGYAVYVQDNWSTLNGRLNIDAGIRYETQDANLVFRNRECCEVRRPAGNTQTTTALDQIFVPGDPQFLDESYDAFGWSVGANYSFSPRIAVYGLVSHSFRLPSFNDMIGFAQSPPEGDPVETIWQVEGGARYLDDQFDLSAAVYYNKFRPRELINTFQDINSPECGDNPTNINTCPFVNENFFFGIENYGVELELGYKPRFAPGLDLRTNIVVQDPKVQGSSFTNVVGVTDNGTLTGFEFITVSQDGRRPGRLATFNLNFLPSFDMKPTTDLPVKLYGQFTYFSSRFSNANDVNVTLYPAYYVANAGALIDITKDFSVQFHVANITNQLTFTEGDPLFFDLKAPDGVSNRGVARPLFGRTARFFLNYRF